MIRRLKLFFLLMIFGIAIIAFPNSALANSLPPGFLVGDDSGLQVGTDGDYFINETDIYPGKTFSRQISLSNYSNEDGRFSIQMVMNPQDEDHPVESSGPIDLLTAISVKLTYQGRTLYEGPLDGNGSPIANQRNLPLNLGTLEVGEVRAIQADFTVSQVNDTYPIENWNAVSKVDFHWVFFSNRSLPDTETSSTDVPNGKLPQTNETRQMLIYMIIGVALLCLFLFLMAKRHKENQSNN